MVTQTIKIDQNKIPKFKIKKIETIKKSIKCYTPLTIKAVTFET